MNWSQPHTVKSNARRAARKAGVDPAKVESFVKAGKTLYRFAMPATAPATAKTPAKAKPKRTKAAPPKAVLKQAASAGFAASRRDKPAKVKPAKTPKAGFDAAKPGKVVADIQRGGKFEVVAAMLRRSGGASMPEIVAITGWKPHSARARISVDVSKLLGKGEVIDRCRQDGVSVYAIVQSKQLELPVGEA